MLKATSRKHRIEEERQDQINYENKILYKKMTQILKHGTGNVSPARKSIANPRVSHSNPVQNAEQVALLHHGRSVTSQPSVQMARRINEERLDSQNQILPGSGLEISHPRYSSPAGERHGSGSPVQDHQNSLDQRMANKTSYFKKRMDSKDTGANLVINRKSLN